MTAVSNAIVVTPAAFQDGIPAKILGLALAALMPALFWTGAIAGAGGVLGFSIALSTLVLTGTAIALFLGAVCAPLMLRA